MFDYIYAVTIYYLFHSGSQAFELRIVCENLFTFFIILGWIYLGTIYSSLVHRRTNRLHESRNIFDTIVNNIIFRSVSFILFLNKTDLLAEKLRTAGKPSIADYFPDYQVWRESNVTRLSSTIVHYTTNFQWRWQNCK